MPSPAFSGGSCAAPPRMANSSAMSGTVADSTSHRVSPRGVVTVFTLTAEEAGETATCFCMGAFPKCVS